MLDTGAHSTHTRLSSLIEMNKNVVIEMGSLCAIRVCKIFLLMV